MVVWHKSLAVLSTWEVGLLYSGFCLGTGRIYPTVTKVASLLLWKARWHILFGMIILLPSLLPSLAWRTSANTCPDEIHPPSLKWWLAKPVFTEHWCMSNEEAVLQNTMPLDIFTTLQGGFMFVPGKCVNEPSLLNHIGPQMNISSDLTSSLGELTHQWFGSWCSYWEIKFLFILVIIF